MKTATSLENAMKIEGVDARESARMMKLAGFDGVDVSLSHDMTEPEKIMRPEWAQKVFDEYEALKAEGLEVAQCHLPYAGPPASEDRSIERFLDWIGESWIRAVEVAGQIGCPVAVVHPFSDAASEAEVVYEGNVRLIETLLPTLKKWNVKLALENCYDYNKGYIDAHAARPEDIMEILKRTDEEYVGACIDTGHANIFRLHPAKMARMYGKRLFALHINGNEGQDAHGIPYSIAGWTEHIDYYDLSAALKEIGFEGYYNLELAPGPLPKGTGQAYLNFAGAVARALGKLAD